MRKEHYIDSMGVRRGPDGMADPPYPKASREERKLAEWIHKSSGLPVGWVRYARDGWEAVRTLAGPMVDVSVPGEPCSVYGFGRHWWGALIDLLERCKQAKRLKYWDGFANKDRFFYWDEGRGVFIEEA